MENLKRRLEEDIPTVEYLNESFSFIRNGTLKTNISISFQYFLFLITLEKEITLPGSVSYSIYKNMLLNAASIVEGALHYLLNELIKEGVFNEEKIMGTTEVYSNRKTLYTTNDGIEVCGILYHKKTVKLKANSGFQEINRACKRAKIIDDQLFVEVEDLRDKRNKIHLAGLNEVDDFYDKKDSQRAAEVIAKVLHLLEEKQHGSIAKTKKPKSHQ